MGAGMVRTAGTMHEHEHERMRVQTPLAMFLSDTPAARAALRKLS